MKFHHTYISSVTQPYITDTVNIIRLYRHTDSFSNNVERNFLRKEIENNTSKENHIDFYTHIYTHKNIRVIFKTGDNRKNTNFVFLTLLSDYLLYLHLRITGQRLNGLNYET